MAMITLGAGEVLGGIAQGIFIDKFGSKNAVYVNIINVAIASSLVTLYVYLDSYSWLAYMMTLAWGW